MPDPYELFKANPRKHTTLKALWPELHELLAGKAAKDEAEAAGHVPVVPCCLSPCSSLPSGQRPAAVARVKRWGAHACKRHVDELSDRPGGWPLDLKEHRNGPR